MALRSVLFGFRIVIKESMGLCFGSYISHSHQIVWEFIFLFRSEKACLTGYKLAFPFGRDRQTLFKGSPTSRDSKNDSSKYSLSPKIRTSSDVLFS